MMTIPTLRSDSSSGTRKGWGEGPPKALPSDCHPMYTNPGLSLQCRSSRAHQTVLARFRSGHLRSMTFVQEVKSFFICPCSLPASPAHLLDCWGISLLQLFEDQDLGCDTIIQKGQMDLV
ncbi:uncharacterized protein TNCV_170951 [Trichonephila clavipes]|nr:uncharacterized protein TNCV_170951 [Trichonephila clavipes]